MKTSFFDFTLPESLIADRPASPRDAARMLVVDAALQDTIIRDLPSFLKPGDVLVMNDTRVIPARLWGKKGDARIEVLLHKWVPPLTSPPQAGGINKNSPPACGGTTGGNIWQCFAKPGKKLKPGDRIEFADNFHATVKDKLPDGQVVLEFSAAGAEFRRELEAHGHMPLPPYIEKRRKFSPRLRGELEGGGDIQSLPPPTPPASGRGDFESYQTVYAEREGSVAAPTAGLHFTEALLNKIDAAGVKRVRVTLHVGGGTFLPVKADDTKDHVMHSEWAEVTPEAAQVINEAKRVIAVGTTSLRTLESACLRRSEAASASRRQAADGKGRVQPFCGETDIFITPGYKFKAVDMLLTNFHLPRSTLFMLVCAFAGTERMKAAYAHAIAEAYRFYSYGDACLLYKNES